MKRCNQFLIVVLLLLWSGVSQGAFKFIGWADNRPYDAGNRARFQWALQEANRVAGGGPLFHVVPGDYDLTAQTDEDIANISDVKTWHYAPGNHDPEQNTATHWSMDVENVHFVFLNEYLTGDGRVGDSDYNWLVNDLNANTKPAVFVIGHEPAFPENRHVGDSLDALPAERDRFWNLLNERKVLAYICGHTHVYSTYSDSAGPTIQIDLGNAGNPSITGNPQTFVIFDVTDQKADAYVYDGFQNESYNGGFSFSMPVPTPVQKAQNPSPANGAVSVSTSATLSWTAGPGAVSHDVWLWETGSAEVRVSEGQAGTSYTPTLEPETQYSWRIDEHYSGQPVVTGDTWDFTTKADTTYCYFTGETSVKGSVTGSGNTEDSDGAYESITEVLSVPNKNGYSTLEHVWQFTVPTGEHVEFHIEAFHTASADGDDFALSYSTDGSAYVSMLTVTKTADDNAGQVCALPSGTNGTVYVKVQDTNRAKGSQDMDTLHVDRMYIVSSDNPISQPPSYKAGNPSPADGATGVATDVTLTWTAGDEATAHNVYLGTDGASLSEVSHGQTGTSYPPGTLTQETTYCWRIDEVRAGGTVETGIVWSFATVGDPGVPTTMTASVETSTKRAAPPDVYGVATVTVVNNLGEPVSNAMVEGTFTGDFWFVSRGPTATDAAGKATFTTEPSFLKKPSFGFQVTAVTHPSLTWQP